MMSKIHKLPFADSLCQENQSEAYIRSHTVTWENPMEDNFYLEYSYNCKDWYALNGGNSIPLPQDELTIVPEFLEYSPNGIKTPIALLKKLQKKFGAPEPIYITGIEEVTISKNHAVYPDSVAVQYSNGMVEKRTIIWESEKGRIKLPDYPAPLISHRADPFIYRHTDGTYYFIASHTDAGHNLKGNYQYLYLILRCADTLEDLTDNSGRYKEKIVYERKPLGNGTMSPHLWAPEIHFIHGKWYIYYTTTISHKSSWRIRPHCLECEGSNPMNDNWIEKGPIQTTIENDIAFQDFSLDHTYFHHRDNDYLLWAQKTDNISDIFIAKLSNPWTICTPAVKLTHPEYNWELHGFPVNEGPAILKHGDFIFLTFSASGTDALYCMGLLYAKEGDDLLNPNSWKKCPYPVFQSSRATNCFGPGHNSFTRSTDDREDLIVYHGRQEERYLGEGDYQPLYDAGRNTYIGKVFWNTDGMPSFSVPCASLTANQRDLVVSPIIIDDAGV